MSTRTAYVLEPSAAEVDRLLTASRLLAPLVAEACDRAGLGAGGRLIDVGCGPLGALGVLSDLVGPSGTVVGVDLDAMALAAARAALARLGADNVHLLQADANHLTQADLGAGEFDVAFCRLVLMHQPDPAATLRVLAALLRPGGRVIAFDFFNPPTCEPEVPAITRAWQLIIAATRAKGASPNASREYAALCAAAGLTVVSQRGFFLPVPPSVVLTDSAVLLSGARRGVEAAGLATADEVDDILAGLNAEAMPTGLRAYSPETMELIAAKPESLAA